MSKARNIININNHPHYQSIMKRLLCVSLWDYINNYTPLVIDNTTTIRKMLNVLLPNYNVDMILEWLLTPLNNPTKFELMLLYNQMKVPARYIVNRLKVNTTNINKWNQDTTIKIDKTLDEQTMLQVLKALIKITWSKYNFEIFKVIEWNI